jgi:hypothetical protein
LFEWVKISILKKWLINIITNGFMVDFRVHRIYLIVEKGSSSHFFFFILIFKMLNIDLYRKWKIELVGWLVD